MAVVSRSEGGELGVIPGGQHLADHTRIQLVEKRWLGIRVGHWLCISGSGVYGGVNGL